MLEAATGLGRATGNVLLDRNFGVKSGRQGGARGSSAFCVLKSRRIQEKRAAWHGREYDLR